MADIAVETFIRTKTFLLGRFAPPQEIPGGIKFLSLSWERFNKTLGKFRPQNLGLNRIGIIYSPGFTHIHLNGQKTQAYIAGQISLY